MKFTTLRRNLVLFLAMALPVVSVYANEEGAAVTVDQILTSYSLIHKALVVDDLEKSMEVAKALQPQVNQWLTENPNGTEKLNVQAIDKAASFFVTAQDIDEARKAFIQLSQASIALIRADKSLQAKWQLFLCPMVAKNQGYWVQPAGEVLTNPYMGSVMPGCGSKKPW